MAEVDLGHGQLVQVGEQGAVVERDGHLPCEITPFAAGRLRPWIGFAATGPAILIAMGDSLLSLVNGLVFDGVSLSPVEHPVHIEGGVVVGVDGRPPDGARVIDAGGRLVDPGPDRCPLPCLRSGLRDDETGEPADELRVSEGCATP